MKFSTIIRTAFLMFALSATAAHAAELAPADADMVADNGSAEQQFSNSISDSELDSNRGAYAPNAFIYTDLSAYLAGNNATNTVSGNNAINANALAGMNGLATIIQNSGNNVIVQSSTIINVTFDAQPVTTF